MSKNPVRDSDRVSTLLIPTDGGCAMSRAVFERGALPPRFARFPYKADPCVVGVIVPRSLQARNLRATRMFAATLTDGQSLYGDVLVAGYDEAVHEYRDLPAGFEAGFDLTSELPAPARSHRSEREITYEWDAGKGELVTLTVSHQRRDLELLLPARYEAELSRQSGVGAVEGAGDRTVALDGARLAWEECRRFSVAALQRFAEMSLERLKGQYRNGDSRVFARFS